MSSSAAAVKLAPDPKERHEFGFRALRKIQLDDGEGEEGHDVPKTTPFQVESFRRRQLFRYSSWKRNYNYFCFCWEDLVKSK